MKALYDNISIKASQMITRRYSTSFSWSIQLLSGEMRDPVYSIYGFVRLADEIVDSFHGYDKRSLLHEFKTETFTAIERGISTNPVIHAFQDCVNNYQMDHELIHSFLNSMEMDLDDQHYDRAAFDDYILGSAEVVGLMCLCVFVNGDQAAYERLKPSAMSLGAAFQKVNFLRDLKADYEDLGRSYFPGLDLRQFSVGEKQQIEEEIQADFKAALVGIKQLPLGCRFAVYLAYVNYQALYKKIKGLSPESVLRERIRVPNGVKFGLMAQSFVRFKMNVL